MDGANNPDYTKSDIVDFFHQLPHVNISFTCVNDTFNPQSDNYIEALGILAAIPALWLIVTLLAFLIYYLVRCCQTNWKKKRRNLKPLKWMLAIFALICCGGLAAGLYGNDQAHNGVINVQGSLKNIAKTVSEIQNKSRSIQSIIGGKMHDDVQKLNKIFLRPIINTTAHTLLLKEFQMLTKNVSNGLMDITDINEKVQDVNINYVPEFIDRVETIRWPVTMAVLSLLIIFCVLLIVGIMCSSRGLLICFSVCGLLSVVVCWILVSAYLVLCVSTSDFCDDPSSFYQEEVHGVLQQNIVDYYIKCGSSKFDNPFSDDIEGGQKSVKNIKLSLTFVKILGVELYGNQVRGPLRRLSNDVNSTAGILYSLSALLYCEPVHQDYMTAMSSLCTNVIEGTSFMLLSAVLSGVFFTVLIWIASHTWIYIRKKKPPEIIDEADPFLPPTASMRRGRDTSSIVSGYSSGGRDTYGSTGYVRPRYQHTPPQTPHFATYNGRSRHPIEEFPLPMHGRLTPPPSYEQLSHYAVKT